MPEYDHLPHVICDGTLPEEITGRLKGLVKWLPWPDPSTESMVPQAEGALVYFHTPVDRVVLQRLPNLKVISNFGVGIDHIDLEATQQRNLPVGHTPKILNGAVADLAFGLLLAAARQIVLGDRFVRHGNHTHNNPAHSLSHEVHGQTLGILGMGEIGREVARRAAGFDMRVLYHNRTKSAQGESLGAHYVSFDALLVDSDFLVVCLPLTPETYRIIGAKECAMMKPNAILVNVSRGAVIHTKALIRAIQSKIISAAGLDVTDPEPLPSDHPLLQEENVVLTPHQGSATRATRDRMFEVTAENLLRGLRGEPLMSQAAQ